MTGKTDNDAAGGAGLLERLPARLTEKLHAVVERVMAVEITDENTDKVLRTLGLIARTAVAIRAAEAAEHKTTDRKRDRAAKREAAKVHAGLTSPDEGDETDMDEQSTASAESLDQVRARLERRFETMERWLEPVAGDHTAGAGGPRIGGQLDCKGAPVPTPAAPH